MQFLIITSTAFTLAVDIFYEFGPVYLTLKWEIGPPDLIYYNAILCLTLAIGNGWLPNFFSRYISDKKLIISSIIGFIFVILGVVVTDRSLWMLALFGLSGLFIGMVVTLLTVNISNAAPARIQGEVMGVQLSLRVLGDGIICLIGGMLLLLSVKMILLFSGIIALFTLGYYILK